jgi:hypothetical protein
LLRIAEGANVKIHSYTIVHYGLDYLGHALRSVYDHVDVMNVVYTPHPSHGHQTGHAPPERKEDLMRTVLAHDPPGGKVRWHEVEGFYYEGQHRDYALGLCGGADLALVVDCDEMWHGDVLEAALRLVYGEDRARNWLVNFTHLWRSFDWCIRDNMWPVRVVDLRHREGTAYVPRELGEIYHFGYATRSSLMAYKWQIHGHKNELRPEWWRERWAVWPPVEDCHPTCLDTWFPEPFEKERLPELMREHPFYDLRKIE